MDDNGQRMTYLYDLHRLRCLRVITSDSAAFALSHYNRPGFPGPTTPSSPQLPKRSQLDEVSTSRSTSDHPFQCYIIKSSAQWYLAGPNWLKRVVISVYSLGEV